MEKYTKSFWNTTNKMKISFNNFEMDVDKLINMLFDSLNGLINRSDSNIRITITNLSNESLETLKIIKNCTVVKKIILKEIK